MTATETKLDRIAKHGQQLLAIFPNATERDPVTLCKKLRRLQSQAERHTLELCNGDEPGDHGEEWSDRHNNALFTILNQVNVLLGNVNEYQPKTGAKCSCKRGVQRDNCPTCEGTGHVIDFRAIRNRKPLVPVFINRDPRGYALKIDDGWMREHNAELHRDWGGYGIIAPEID